MLPLTSIASTRSSGASSLDDARDRLLDAVLDDLEILLLQPAHELPAVRDDHRHEHGVGADLLGVPEILREDGGPQMASVRELGHRADVLAAHHFARIPRAI